MNTQNEQTQKQAAIAKVISIMTRQEGMLCYSCAW